MNEQCLSCICKWVAVQVECTYVATDGIISTFCIVWLCMIFTYSATVLTLLVFLLCGTGDLLPLLPMLKSKSISSKSTFIRGRETEHQEGIRGTIDRMASSIYKQYLGSPHQFHSKRITSSLFWHTYMCRMSNLWKLFASSLVSYFRLHLEW